MANYTPSFITKFLVYFIFYLIFPLHKTHLVKFLRKPSTILLISSFPNQVMYTCQTHDEEIKHKEYNVVTSSLRAQSWLVPTLPCAVCGWARGRHLNNLVSAACRNVKSLLPTRIRGLVKCCPSVIRRLHHANLRLPSK